MNISGLILHACSSMALYIAFCVQVCCTFELCFKRVLRGPLFSVLFVFVGSSQRFEDFVVVLSEFCDPGILLRIFCLPFCVGVAAFQ